MKSELTDFLNATFPNLFKGRLGRGVCFECDDGWFDIIYSLAHQLEKEIIKLPLEEREGITATQVKEKYGTLRFYMSSETDEMSKFISEAEDKSAVTCETCGDPGEVREHSWIKVLCDKHNKEREEQIYGK